MKLHAAVVLGAIGSRHDERIPPESEVSAASP